MPHLEGERKRWFHSLSRAVIILFSIIIVLVLVMVIAIWLLFPKEDIKNIQTHFPAERVLFEKIAHEFLKMTALDSVELEGNDLISIVPWRKNNSIPEMRNISPSDPIVDDVLREKNIEGSDFRHLLNVMSRVDARTRIGLGRNQKGLYISYPDGLWCSWTFATPYGIQSIHDIALGVVVDGDDGEEGPYILDEKWLVYRNCAG